MDELHLPRRDRCTTSDRKLSRTGWVIWWVLAFAPLVAACVALAFVSGSVPAHFGADGQVDRWGSQWELRILPAVVTVFAAAMAPDGWIAMTVSGILGLVIAGLADHVRRRTRPAPTADTTPAVLISIYEDVVVLIGTLLFVLLPLIGALVAAFLVLLVYRVRVMRNRKHKGLRILRG